MLAYSSRETPRLSASRKNSASMSTRSRFHREGRRHCSCGRPRRSGGDAGHRCARRCDRGFSPDFLEDGREQPEGQERPDLDSSVPMIEYLLDYEHGHSAGRQEVGSPSWRAWIASNRVRWASVRSWLTSSISAPTRARRSNTICETLRLLFADVVILDFDRGDAHAAGEIRASLRAKRNADRPVRRADRRAGQTSRR